MADDSFTEISEISKLKVPDLKKELKNRGLSTAGNKNELIERLHGAIKTNDDTIDDIEEDLLNDDEDDEHLSESGILDQDLEDLPTSQKQKSPPSTEKKGTTEAPKKVILNRTTSLNIPKLNRPPPISQATSKKAIEIPKENQNKESDDDDEKKVVKLTELTVKERLERRAKKFGVSDLSDDVKKLARAERFGITNKNSGSEPIGKLTEATSIDVLKKRAERFGGSVSSVMSTVENKEKLEKRKERFGVTVASKNGLSGDEAKKARLERFKTNPVKSGDV